MEGEYILLSILSKRENYERFAKYLTPLTKEVSLIHKDLGKYYATVHKDEVDWDSFGVWFSVVAHPGMDTETKEMYQKIFHKAKSVSHDPAELPILVQKCIDRATCEEIAGVAERVSEGSDSASIEDVRALLERRDDELGITSDTPRAKWGDPLVSTSGYLRWRMKELNDALGPLGDDLIVVASRPDGGKTTFLASEVTFMVPQLKEGQIVKWYINEEAMPKVQWRILQAALCMTVSELEADWMYTWAEYSKAMGGTDRIDLVDCSGWTTSMLEKDIASSEVGLVVIDQLRKVGGYDRKETSEASRQELLYNWARDVAKKYAPVITVHQASGDGENERWITMEKLHGSKTGVQGEADAIITIGQDSDYPNSRFLYVPKNKMRGDDPLLRNGKFEVKIDKHRARFTGV